MDGEWQIWGKVSTEELASTPVEVKLEWGDRFAEIVPKSAQLYGPVNVFETVCRLVNEDKIELRCRRRERWGRVSWRIEYKFTQHGADYIRVH